MRQICPRAKHAEGNRPDAVVWHRWQQRTFDDGNGVEQVLVPQFDRNELDFVDSKCGLHCRGFKGAPSSLTTVAPPGPCWIVHPLLGHLFLAACSSIWTLHLGTGLQWDR